MTKTKLVWFYFLLISLLSTGVVDTVHGQTFKKRTYANFQMHSIGLLGSVTNPLNAIATAPEKLRDSTSIAIGISLLGLGTTTQFLEFTTDGSHANKRTLAAGTEVTVKLSLPQSLLAVASGISVGSFTNLNTGFLGAVTATQKEIYNGNNLLALLSGYGTVEITMKPDVAFNGVYVSLSGILGLALSTNVYHAYIVENATGSIPCSDANIPIDVLYGVSSGTLNLLGSLVNVDKAYHVLNNNPNQFALMTVIVGALNNAFIQPVFSAANKRTQLVKLVLEDPGGLLLTLSLLSGFSIQPYLYDKPVGPAVQASQFLDLRLLTTGSNKVSFLAKVDVAFDRIDIRMNNTVTALKTLRVYEVSRSSYLGLFPEEQLKNKLTACEKVDLKNAIDEIDLVHYTYKYYTAETGGTALGSSIVNSSGTYYIEAVDKETNCPSFRRLVVANVLPIPGKPHLTIQNVIN